ncbi:sterol desaturase family protein [Sporocytophaga myxococcoides]|uniref:sterol desaturase family protein n=1 Tax=Sporocytophaga myxococcoides TaxID=153721 RepID=UPI0004142479|nr:sterol desaturase family protein [Sporocytophaga myxococcoides]
MQAFFAYLYSLNLISLFLLFLVENAAIALMAVLLGFTFDGLLTEMKRLISLKEIYWTFATIFFNTLVTLAGYLLFKYGFIVFHLESDLLNILIDFVVLIFAMDLLMYVFHRAIHKMSFVYRYHDLHHAYDTPTAISLFVLHPIEVMGFGSLWLMLLFAVDFSIYAVMLYLVFNVAMGIIGHLRKEIVPKAVKYNVCFQWLANTGFHVDHHQHEQHNFGFYTKVWDRLFGTLK